MAKSQGKGTTISLGLEGHKVGEVSEEEKGRCFMGGASA